VSAADELSLHWDPNGRATRPVAVRRWGAHDTRLPAEVGLKLRSQLEGMPLDDYAAGDTDAEPAASPPEGKLVDLMAALEESVREAKAARNRKRVLTAAIAEGWRIVRLADVADDHVDTGDTWVRVTEEWTP